MEQPALFLPPLPDYMPALAKAVAREIEALVDEPPLYSQTARTPRGTVHVAYANGVRKAEGEQSVDPASPMEICAKLLDAAKEARAAVPGDAILIWRVEPTWESTARGFEMWTRFCFEAL